MSSWLKEVEQKMQKCLATLKTEFTKIRTGRAHTSLLDHIKVEYYGSTMPLNQVASVTIADPRTLAITPWDKSMIQPIEKAIKASDLGLNPVSLGNSLRVPMPPLTEERRKDLIKVVKNEAETARVSVRNIRRDANTKAKDQLKQKEISEDEEKHLQERIQKLTDTYIQQIDQMLHQKEQELIEI